MCVPTNWQVRAVNKSFQVKKKYYKGFHADKNEMLQTVIACSDMQVPFVLTMLATFCNIAIILAPLFSFYLLLLLQCLLKGHQLFTSCSFSNSNSFSSSSSSCYFTSRFGRECIAFILTTIRLCLLQTRDNPMTAQGYQQIYDMLIELSRFPCCQE